VFQMFSLFFRDSPKLFWYLMNLDYFKIVIYG